MLEASGDSNEMRKRLLDEEKGFTKLNRLCCEGLSPDALSETRLRAVEQVLFCSFGSTCATLALRFASTLELLKRNENISPSPLFKRPATRADNDKRRRAPRWARRRDAIYVVANVREGSIRNYEDKFDGDLQLKQSRLAPASARFCSARLISFSARRFKM